ncbi:helix-turn-helix domain-containing protein [bacterium]|nr:helix-turn-helix domain-containing protein [bacterium]
MERAEHLGLAAGQLAQGHPLRQVAAELGVARSTLRGWRAAAPLAGLPAEVATCLATPAGAQWLHQLVVMHLIITLRAGAGVRLVCEFLELSGLSAVVGASYGRQYAVTVQVQEAVATQAQEQRVALAVGMPTQELTACEDETFHPDVCLVAIEPVSNFILLEQ